MPVYEYYCNQCKKDFSVQLSMKEHEKQGTPACSHCGGKDVKLQFSSIFVVTSKKS